MILIKQEQAFDPLFPLPVLYSSLKPPKRGNLTPTINTIQHHEKYKCHRRTTSHAKHHQQMLAASLELFQLSVTSGDLKIPLIKIWQLIATAFSTSGKTEIVILRTPMLLYRSREEVQASFHKLFPVYIERDIVIFKIFFFCICCTA